MPIPGRRIALVHHDLGLGGAERLVVEAALALAELGHDATIHTARWDPEQTFAEAREGAFRIAVHPPVLPPTLGGVLRAPLTHARLAQLAYETRAAGPHDAYLLDGVPTAAPYLRRRTSARILYYCHYPDLLLAPRGGVLRRAYRWPLDTLERESIRAAHHLFANSEFTRERMREVFGDVATSTQVLRPPVRALVPPPGVRREPHTLLALHRFDLAKNVLLAVDAFGRISRDFPAARLIVAGGHDARFRGDREAREAIVARASALGVLDRVELVLNPSDEALLELFARSGCVVYTPVAEHFGIVPIEAMSAGVPVVAVDAAGPRETVMHEGTGLLVAPTVEAFAGAIGRILRDPDFAAELGAEGIVRSRAFTRAAFRDRLGAALEGSRG